MIYAQKEAISKNLQELLISLDPSSILVLMDSNTTEHCEPLLQPMLPFEYQRIVIGTGEAIKNWETLMSITEKMYQMATDRHAVLISLGGGVVTDLGGMAASIYHRGLRCIHIPTSLLGMCDAAIGGKNGINLHQTKNQIGTFYRPEAVFIFDTFLDTLPEREFRNGQVELIKTLYLMRQPIHDLSRLEADRSRIIAEAAEYKESLTRTDFHDQDKRRFLNIGHTIGHGLEAYYHDTPHSLMHGEAVLLGLYYEHLFMNQKLQSSYFEELIRDSYSELLTLPKPEKKQVEKAIRYDKKSKSLEIELPYLTDVYGWETQKTSAALLAEHTYDSWLS